MGVKNLVIHIGSDKAGSTAIQECLNVNRQWYSDRSIHIPTTGFMKMAGHPHLFTNLESPSIRRDLANEIRQLDNVDTALVSWEGVHFFDTDQRRELALMIETCFPAANVTFVYYIREQLSLIQSGLLQQVKQLALTPERIQEVAKPFHQVAQHHVQLLCNDKRLFHRRITQWQEDFPTATFDIRMYDRAVLLNGDVIDDFHQALGLELDDEFMRPTGFANTSLTAEAAIVLGEYFRYVWTEDDRRRLIDSVLSFRDGTSKYLHETSQRVIRDYYREDNRRLAQDFPSCAVMDQLDTPAPKPIDDDTVEACRKFLAAQSEFPTLLFGSLAGTELNRLNLVSGWGQVNMRGVWAIDEVSVLQFRPRSMHFGGLTPGVIVNFAGKLRGRRAAPEHLTVNGHSYGDIDPFESEIFIPLEHLDDSYGIRMEFRATKALRSDPDEPARRFRITNLDYSVLQTPSEVPKGSSGGATWQ